MDFVSDCTAGGRTIRALTLVHDYTRECLAIEVDTSIAGLWPTSFDLIWQALIERHGKQSGTRQMRPSPL
jgi:putative transposase